MAKSFSVWNLFFLLLSCIVLVSANSEDDVPITANIDISASFPDNPFGLIINGQRNKVLLSVSNKEDLDLTVVAVSGKITDPENPDKILRNLTGLRYDLTIPSADAVEIPYVFYSEFAPGDHGLTVFVDIAKEDKFLRFIGYNGVITVTDPETSWFDPQLMFIYFVLGALGLGIAHVIRKAFFGGSSKTKTKRAAKEPAQAVAHRDEKGQMVLDESWIPEHLLKESKSPKKSPKVKNRSQRK